MVWLWVCIGDGSLRCSFNLSPKDQPDSLIYSSRQLLCRYLNWHITALFCILLSLSLVAMIRVLMVLLPLDINKVSGLHCHLKEKYGLKSFKLIRNWENIVKKMVDFQNHRKFTFRCIKLGITPVSCRLKLPMNTPKSYHIIHKTERQMLYDRVGNINNTLYVLKLKRSECYDTLRNLIQDRDIS